MKTGLCKGVMAGIIACLAPGCGKQPAPVSLATQLSRLSTVDTFYQPAQGVSDMFSSFDCQGGNCDWFNFGPALDKKAYYPVTTLKGPGSLTRIWCTNVPATEWLFFFDGETEPRLQIAQDALFTHNPLFNPLQGGVSGGAYAYIPLTYAKSLTIALRMPNYTPNGARPYFQINSERYPAGTTVQSWPKTFDAATSNALIACNTAWRATRSNQLCRAEAHAAPWQKQTFLPQQSTTVFSTETAGTITSFRFRPDFSRLNALTRSLMLRYLVLEMYWDGQTSPSVRVPLGDFFCNGLHPREFANMAFAFQNNTYVCALPMPFRKSARIVIRNDGPFPIESEVSTACQPGSVDDTLYLHCAFNAEVSAGRPFRIMQTTGRGKYIGCYLMAFGMDGGWNILEGDERFYRDGSATPSHHGTGLEDYFNGGWYYYGLFELPLHGLLEKAAMRTAQYRFHLTDAVTFQRDVRMELEFGDGNTAGGYLSAAAYWYQDRPVGVKSEIPPVEKRFVTPDKVGVAAIMAELFELERAGLIATACERCAFYAAAFGNDPNHLIFTLRAAAYAEMLQGYTAVKETYAAIANTPQAPHEIVEQAKLLLWRGEKPGRGIYGAHGFGDFKLFVDGKPLGAGNTPQAWSAFPVELSPGDHMLEAEITPHHAYAFLSCGFSSFFTNVVSDASWDYQLPSGKWAPYPGNGSLFPGMAFWQFVPNAFPCVQSGYQQGPPIPKWTDAENLGKPVRIRRKITVPEALTADRPQQPPRVFWSQDRAVRPADDTSNDHLTPSR